MYFSEGISLHVAQRYIYSFDLSYVIAKLVVTQGWLREDAIQTSIFYRNFLFLSKKYGGLVPSLDIDEFWHHHILNTQKYTRDCGFIFGEYFHHYPFLGSRVRMDKEERKKGFARTQELHIEEFGEPIYATKSRYPTLVYGLMKFAHKATHLG